MKIYKIIILTAIFILIQRTICYCQKSTYVVTSPALQYVKATDSSIRIANKYDKNNDMWIEFKKCGINSIMGINAIYLAPNGEKTASSNLERESQLLLKSCTDWVSPYIVKSNKNKENGNPDFTGGWHNIGRNSTAITTNYKISADEKVISLNKETLCEKVRIQVTNLVQGFNTVKSKRYILKETINYTIYSVKIDVEVETEALEDITILRYYGLQTQNTAWNGNIFYLNGLNEKGSINSKTNSTSGSKSQYPDVSILKLCSANKKHRLTAWLDRKYGLGNMEFVSNSQTCAFTRSYGKSYFNLINGIEKVLQKGAKVSWRGGYIFTYNQT